MAWLQLYVDILSEFADAQRFVDATATEARFTASTLAKRRAVLELAQERFRQRHPEKVAAWNRKHVAAHYARNRDDINAFRRAKHAAMRDELNERIRARRAARRAA